MKPRLFYFIFFSLLLFSSIRIFSQSGNSIKESGINPSMHVDTGVSCSGGPGSEIHDDSALNDSCRYVIKMRPAVYPWSYLTVCVTFTRISSGQQNLTFDIIVYDTTGSGGAPGNLVAIFTGKVAPNINIFPLTSAYRYTFLNIPYISSGAYYIGIRWHNNPSTGVYLAQDESPSTPLWPGYQGTGSGPNPTWILTQNGAGQQAYRCSAIRTEGAFAIVPLCEQFAVATFPPTGWSLNYTGTLYWERAAQSGFGLGTGSARYDMWNAPVGDNQSMVTLSFNQSQPGDSLVMDIAFQPWQTAQDSLIILTSTNDGSTFTSLVRLGPLQMQTATGQPQPFMPTASQWQKRKYGPLPVGTDRIQFLGKSQFGDGVYIDSICVLSNLTGIIHNINLVPGQYSLAQNYPNPFNPSTVISYSLPKSGNIKLTIFDVLGREVKVLENGYKQAGSYDVIFDGSNFASGVYFYKMVVGDPEHSGLNNGDSFTATKKMLMVK